MVIRFAWTVCPLKRYYREDTWKNEQIRKNNSTPCGICLMRSSWTIKKEYGMVNGVKCEGSPSS